MAIAFAAFGKRCPSITSPRSHAVTNPITSRILRLLAAQGLTGLANTLPNARFRGLRQVLHVDGMVFDAEYEVSEDIPLVGRHGILLNPDEYLTEAWFQETTALTTRSHSVHPTATVTLSTVSLPGP